jgi:hypothetical protein
MRLVLIYLAGDDQDRDYDIENKGKKYVFRFSTYSDSLI